MATAKRGPQASKSGVKKGQAAAAGAAQDRAANKQRAAINYTPDDRRHDNNLLKMANPQTKTPGPGGRGAVAKRAAHRRGG